jgi:hypothetical protein
LNPELAFAPFPLIPWYVLPVVVFCVTRPAEPLYRRALIGAEKVLGPNHPHTRIVRESLEALHSRMSSA